MEELAADPTVSERLPFVREALLAGASPQLRNMATIGGNLLQRTRCRYFRDPTVAACNKRAPGSGARPSPVPARMHAILGASEHCIAVHASDLCVPLVALDAVVHLQGADGQRSVPLTEFYVLPGDRPDVETVLEHGELITQMDDAAAAGRRRSGYLKVRDRASYEFALTSAAAALLDRGRHHRRGPARPGRRRDDPVAGPRGRGDPPRRTRRLRDVPGRRGGRDPTTRSPLPGTAFKVELAKRTIVRILQTVSGVQP